MFNTSMKCSMDDPRGVSLVTFSSSLSNLFASYAVLMPACPFHLLAGKFCTIPSYGNVSVACKFTCKKMLAG